MSPCICVYSQDSTRGKIVFKSLEANGIEPVLCVTAASLKETVSRSAADFIIFDLKDTFWDGLAVLRDQSKALRGTVIIVLCDAARLPLLKKQTALMKNILCAPDPLNPDFIVSMVDYLTKERAKKKVFSHAL